MLQQLAGGGRVAQARGQVQIMSPERSRQSSSDIALTPRPMNPLMVSFLFVALGALVGAAVPIWVSGVPLGDKGLRFYGMVHVKPLNRWIHTVGMPFTSFGGLSLLPVGFQAAVFAAYIAHYASFAKDAHLRRVVALYLPVLYCSMSSATTLGWHAAAARGLACMICALVFQEVIGHWLSGDPQSRMTKKAIANAVIYAPLFSVSHFG